MDKTIDRRILEFLRNHGDRPFRLKEIAKRLDIRETSEFQAFMEAANALVDLNKVVVFKGGRIGHKHAASGKDGILSVNRRGNGFVRVRDSSDDYFVHKKNFGVAMHGDTVRVLEEARGRKNDLREATRLEVLERGTAELVGTINVGREAAWVIPDDKRINRSIFVDLDHVDGAISGDKVIASIDKFDNAYSDPEGRVLEVLGRSGEYKTEVLSIARGIGIKSEFSDEVLSSLETVIAKPWPADRVDLTEKTIFTIDPETANDFDDAIQVEKAPNGHFIVGVHIADVSYYVEPNTAVDMEAADRGTSVYLVDRVIPMLPEILSNDRCSLNPNEDKLAYSCLIELDKDLEVVSHKLEETIIHSKARLTYEQAQAILDDESDVVGKIDSSVAAGVLLANEIAARLRSKRYAKGSIDFDLPEIEVDMNDEGEPINIRRKIRLDAHRLVEEFMLLANKVVAESISTRKNAPPFVYRIHERPDADRLNTLGRFVASFGHGLKTTGGLVSPSALAKLISDVKGTPYETIVVDASLRAMAKARYSTENLGHFGLAFDDYTHFTSPIRRYPDLVAHRLLKDISRGKVSIDRDSLEQICQHSSEREKDATEAERESVRFKQVVYMQKHLGDVFEGVVSGITNFGIFVQLSDVMVEGMISLRDLDDHYVLDEDNYQLVGRKTGRTFRAGDVVRAIVVRVDTESREIDLFLENDDTIADSGR